MYIIRNLLKLIFVYFPILLVLIGTFFFAHKNYEVISDNLEDFTCAVLSQYMNTNIKAEKIIVHGTKITVHNIEVKDQNNKELINAKKVFVKLSPFSPIQICKSVYIDTATANIYEHNNKWNFDFIVNKFYTKEYLESKYVGPVILIVNSKINIKSDTYKYNDHLTNASSRMDFSHKDYAKYNINFVSLYSKNIRAYANLTFDQNQLKLKVTGEKLNLALINHYKNFIKNKKFAPVKNCVFHGYSDFEINAKTKNNQVERFSVNSSTEKLSINSPYGNIENTKFFITGNEKILTYKIKGDFNKANIYSKGQISLKDINNFQGKFIVKNADFTNFSKILPKDYKSLKGKINCEATILGNLKNPHISGKIKGKNIAYNSYFIKDINSKLELKNKTINYELESSLKNGKVYSHGEIDNINIFKPDINKITTNALLCVRNISIQDYAPYSANLVGDFSIKGKITNPNVKSNIEISKGIFNLNKTKYKDISANISLDYFDQKVHIKSGYIQSIYNNKVIFSGTIDRKLNCDLNLSLNNVDISKFAKDFNEDIKGIASLKSHIIKGEKIHTENLLNLEDFSYKNISINFAQVNFNLNSDKIKVNNCTILDFPATVSFTGNIIPKNKNIFDFKSKNYLFDFTISENNLTTKKICEKINMNYNDLKAVTRGDLSIKGAFVKGKIENLSGGGELSVNNIEYKDLSFSNIQTKIDLKDTIISLYDIKGSENTYSVISKNLFASIEGKASFDINDGFYNGNLTVNNISINDFKNYFQEYMDCYGFVNFNVDFKGQYNKCDANFKGHIDRLIINSKTYDKIPINLTLKDSDIINGDFTCKRNNQFITGKFNNISLVKKEIGDLFIEAKNLEVNDLREIFYLSPIAKKPNIENFLKKIPVITEGSLEGKLQVSGSFNAPNGTCEIIAENINADFDKINKVTANLSAKKGIIDLDNLEIEGTEFLMTCDAHPLFDNQNAKINVTLINLPLSRFGKYLDINNIKGTLSAEALIEGNLSAPNITTSLNIDNPIIDNIEMKELQAAKIDIDSNYINFPQGVNLFITDNNLVKLEGKIPLSVIKSKTTDEEIDLKLSAPKQDLNIIEKVCPYVVKDSTKGIFYADANLKGPFNNAELTGIISIDEGELVTLGNTKLKNINTKINLSNDNNKNVIFNIDKLSFSDDNLKEDSFKITEGYVKIFNSSFNTDTLDFNKAFGEGEVNINALIDNYFIETHDFSDYQDKSVATINGNIKVEGNLIEPRIFTESPIVLSNISSSFKTASTNSETLVKLTNENNDTKLFSYLDATEYDEIQRVRNRNKHITFNPSFDIYLTTEKAEIRPPATYIKADANMSLTGNLNHPVVKGEGIITEGKINFAIARARIDKDSKLNFTFENDTLTGNIDASAFSYVHCNDKTGQDQRYKINIIVTGDITDPNIDLISDPLGLTVKEIITAFTGFNNNKISAEETLAKIGANTLLAPVEDFLVENFGFDSLDFAYKQNNYAYLEVEKSFNNKLYGTLISNLYNKKDNNMSSTHNTDLPIWDLIFGYRFNSRFNFNLGTTSKKEHTIKFNYGFKF